MGQPSQQPDLQRFIQRDISPLMIDLIMRSWSNPKHWVALTNSFVHPRHLVVLTTDWYFDFNFFHELSAILDSVSPKWWDQAFDQFYANGKKLLHTSQVLAKELKHETVQKLQQGLFRYELATQQFAYCLIFTHVANLHWEKQIDKWLSSLPTGEKESAKEILTRPVKLNTTTLERRSLCELRLWQNTHPIDEDKLKKKIQAHLGQFGLLASRGDLLQPWTIQDILHRLHELSVEEAGKTLEDISHQEKTAKQDLKNLFKRFPELKQHAREIEIIKELVYFRTYRTETLYSSFYYFWPALERWSNVVGLPLRELVHLRVSELEELRGDTVASFAQIAQDRQRGFGVWLNEGLVSWVTGEEYQQLKNRFAPEVSQTEFSGLPAFQGQAQGRAVVVITKADLGKVQPGDILITPMTNPDFVMAMEKASAFVTDEGGITCHAAILAREMKKPCVIGTKIATRSINDGDIVQVDAVTGKVRLLHKHS